VLCQLYFCGLAKTETQQPSNVSDSPTHKLNIAKALGAFVQIPWSLLGDRPKTIRFITQSNSSAFGYAAFGYAAFGYAAFGYAAFGYAAVKAVADRRLAW